jgi:hypothetical protein
MNRLFRCIAMVLVVVPVLVSAQRVPELHLQRMLRIDADAANLSPVTFLAVSRNGHIIVGQAQDHLVRFFDPAGTAEGTLGRDGAGPGEFRRIEVAGWVGDTLWVEDFGTHRFTLIGPDRKFIRNVPLAVNVKVAEDSNTTAMVLGAAALNADGSQMLEVLVPSEKTERPSWAADDQGTGSRALLVNVSARQIVQRVVRFAPHDDCGMVTPPGYELCGHNTAGVEANGNYVAWVAMGVGGADSGSYHVMLYRKSGALVYSRKYPFVAQAIPSRIRDSLIDMGKRVHGPVIAAAMMPTIPPPTIYPPVGSLLIASDGSVWIQLRATADGMPWIILSPRGAVVGHLVAPRDSKLLVVSADMAWGTEKDADDQESVVRYRITGVTSARP